MIGDRDLRHAIGVVYVSDSDVLNAERHLRFGTTASASRLGSLHAEWAMENPSEDPGNYLARSVLPYLAIGNIQHAKCALASFERVFSSTSKAITIANATIAILPNAPLYNFLTLLIQACQRAVSEFLQLLKSQYTTHLATVLPIWNPVMCTTLVSCANRYFSTLTRLPKSSLACDQAIDRIHLQTC